jgi:hypothetical protein
MSMAGSYRHVTDHDGQFSGLDSIDNLGDAYEAIEEMHDMIAHLTGGDRQKIFEAWRDGYVRKRLPKRIAEEPDLFTFERFWYRSDE